MWIATVGRDDVCVGGKNGFALPGLPPVCSDMPRSAAENRAAIVLQRAKLILPTLLPPPAHPVVNRLHPKMLDGKP